MSRVDHGKLCPCGKHDEPAPTIYRSTSAKEGGCNFCNRHISPRGSVDHAVTVVKSANPSGGLIVRFCDFCRAHFVIATSPKPTVSLFEQFRAVLAKAGRNPIDEGEFWLASLSKTQRRKLLREMEKHNNGSMGVSAMTEWTKCLREMTGADKEH